MSKQKPQWMNSLTAHLENSEAVSFIVDTSSDAIARAVVKFHPQGKKLSFETTLAKTREALEVLVYESRAFHTSGSPPWQNPIDAMCILKDKAHFDEMTMALDFFMKENLDYRAELIGSLIKGDSVLDIGCGRGALLKELQMARPGLGLFGIDPHVPESVPGIEFSGVDLFDAKSEAPWQADTVLLLHVLHHTGDHEEKLLSFLERAKKAARKRLIIIEDVMLDETSVQGLTLHDETLADNKSLAAYLKMDFDQQKAVLSILDALINAGVFGAGYMPFPFYFKAASQWESIFNKDGWSATGILPDRIFNPASFFHGPYVAFVVDRE